MHQNIILTICVSTYNHGRFINKCLDSILKQVVNFTYEIVISDAGSTDNTVLILKDYEKNNPDKIILLIPNKRNNLLENIINLIPHLKGKYVAFIDGDDSYSYESKLQVQIDFLSKNPDFIGCFHDALIIPENQEINFGQNLTELTGKYIKYSNNHKYKEAYYAVDAIRRKIIPTASLIFRRIDLKPVIDLIIKTKAWSPDWVLHLMLLKDDQKLFYFSETWSIYNDHKGGITKLHGNIGFHISNFDILYYLLHDQYYRQFKTDILSTALQELKIIIRSDKAISKIKSKWIREVYMHHLYNLRLHYIYNLRHVFKNIIIFRFLILIILNKIKYNHKFKE